MAKTFYLTKICDHLCKIAVEAKQDPDKLWQANGDLQKIRKRKNPLILYTGVEGLSTRRFPDSLVIPREEKKVKAQLNKINPHVKPAAIELFLRLRILKEDFQPVADNTKYFLTVWDAKGKSWDQPGEAWTPPAKLVLPPLKNGLIEVKIPPTAQKAELVLRLKAKDADHTPPPDPKKPAPPPDKANHGDVPVKWELKIGALNPVMELGPNEDCISGVQQRLNNLGFDSGAIDGIRGSVTTAAVKAFQTLFKLKVDGIPGQKETQPKIQEVYDTANPVKLP